MRVVWSDEWKQQAGCEVGPSFGETGLVIEVGHVMKCIPMQMAVNRMVF